MKKIIIILTFFLLTANAGASVFDRIGLGLVGGDPTGFTVKYRLDIDNSIVMHGGSSFFGKVHINFDYHLYYDIFDYQYIRVYLAPGISFGYGNGEDFFDLPIKSRFYTRKEGEVGIGIRTTGGLNIITENGKLEFFLETGFLTAVSPDFNVNTLVAIGVRFYL